MVSQTMARQAPTRVHLLNLPAEILLQIVEFSDVSNLSSNDFFFAHEIHRLKVYLKIPGNEQRFENLTFGQ